MRTLFGIGTPRGLQGRLAAVLAIIVALWTHSLTSGVAWAGRSTIMRPRSRRIIVSSCCPSAHQNEPLTTGS